MTEAEKPLQLHLRNILQLHVKISFPVYYYTPKSQVIFLKIIYALPILN